MSVLQGFAADTLFSRFEIYIIAALSFVFAFATWALKKEKLPPNCPKGILEDLPIVGALRFFGNRWDLFRENALESSTGNFSFHISQYSAVGLSGHNARSIFLESKHLAFAEAYSTLLGVSPPAKAEATSGKDITGTGDFNAWFIKRLSHMIKRENFARGLSQLVADCRGRVDALRAKEVKITDPFESVYRMVFHLTMRTVGCTEIADNPELLEEVLQLYEKVERASKLTPMGVRFPNFPRPAYLRRTYYGGKLYMIFKKIVDERKRSGRRHDDALQFLIDKDDSAMNILAFIMGALTAALFNTGVLSAYCVTALTQHRKWLNKIRAEVENAAERYRVDKDATIADCLSQVPIESWETDFPSIELVLRESQRLGLYGTIIRWNISGKDISVGEEIIPNGSFALYHVADTHMNPEIYTDPFAFDPDRYSPDRAEDKKEPHAWLGWGAGRHPCLGMKFAKLEVSIIVALFVASFDYTLCDADGNPATQLPPPELNAFSAKKPAKPVYLKYASRDVKA